MRIKLINSIDKTFPKFDRGELRRNHMPKAKGKKVIKSKEHLY